MKKKLLALMAKKEARKAELLTKSGTTEDITELRGINTELETINSEINELRDMIAAIPDEDQRSADPVAGAEQRAADPQILASYGAAAPAAGTDERKKITDSLEKRGADLKAGKTIIVAMEESPEERAVTVATSNLVLQKKYSGTIGETFEAVSTLVDRVEAVPLNGGESYTKAFEVSFGEGGYTTETGDYAEADPVVDYVEIGKAKITAYSEITDEAQKLPNLNYQALVIKGVRNAIRKKITKQILIGAGGTNAITGIFNAPTNVIPLASDVEVSAIDEDTLDKIVFSYGGDENVEGEAALILSKMDLAAFNAVRLDDGKKAYKITLNADGNTGTISSENSFAVPFIINSACPPLSLAATLADTYCMAYGKLQAYEMPVFSAITIDESRDYKFRSGQIAYRGAVWVGGNVASYKGFVRIIKVAGL